MAPVWQDGQEDTFGNKLCANCGRASRFRREFARCATCRRAWFCSPFCQRFAAEKAGEGGHREVCFPRQQPARRRRPRRSGGLAGAGGGAEAAASGSGSDSDSDSSSDDSSSSD